MLPYQDKDLQKLANILHCKRCTRGGDSCTYDKSNWNDDSPNIEKRHYYETVEEIVELIGLQTASIIIQLI
jgi:hypothetical protein